MNRRFGINSAGAIALAALCVSGFALAAPRTAPVKDPAAQARAQELIDSVRDGDGVFRAEDTGNVVHIRSGMACAVGDEMLSLVRVSIRPSFTLGDDVTCDYTIPGGKAVLFATRLGGANFQTFAAEAQRVFAAANASAKPAGPLMSLDYPGIGRPAGQSFAVTVDGKPAIASMWIAHEGDWALMVRATYPEPRHDPEYLAAAVMMYAQTTIHENATRPRI